MQNDTTKDMKARITELGGEPRYDFIPTRILVRILYQCQEKADLPVRIPGYPVAIAGWQNDTVQYSKPISPV